MLAKNIETRRKKMGLSQRELARVSGISREMLRIIEIGKNTNPKYKTLEKLAKTFNCTIEELMK